MEDGCSTHLPIPLGQERDRDINMARNNLAVKKTTQKNPHVYEL